MSSSATAPATLCTSKQPTRSASFKDLVREVRFKVFHWQLATAAPGARRPGVEDPYRDQLREVLASQRTEDLAKLVGLAIVGRNYEFDEGTLTRAAGIRHPKTSIVSVLMENERLREELERGLQLAADAGFDVEQELPVESGEPRDID
jgi:hypothetical protein